VATRLSVAVHRSRMGQRDIIVDEIETTETARRRRRSQPTRCGPEIGSFSLSLHSYRQARRQLNQTGFRPGVHCESPGCSSSEGTYRSFLFFRAHSLSRVESAHASAASLSIAAICSNVLAPSSVTATGRGLVQLGLPRRFGTESRHSAGPVVVGFRG
jgi:hypothetical protein